MSDSIATVIFTCYRGVNSLSLALFRLDEHNHQILVNANVPNEVIQVLEQRLNSVMKVAINQNVTESLPDLLELAYQAIQNQNANIQNIKCLAIMIIDGTLGLGDNPSIISAEFRSRGISLAVVATVTPTYEVWDHFRTLADYTGGAYMLLENALVTLERVIPLVINGEDTLRQAFHHLRTENTAVGLNVIDGMNEQNQTIDGVGELDFDHGLFE